MSMACWLAPLLCAAGVFAGEGIQTEAVPAKVQIDEESTVLLIGEDSDAPQKVTESYRHYWTTDLQHQTHHSKAHYRECSAHADRGIDGPVISQPSWESKPTLWERIKRLFRRKPRDCGCSEGRAPLLTVPEGNVIDSLEPVPTDTRVKQTGVLLPSS